MTQIDVASILDDLRLLLWRTGHYRNPKYPDTHDVTREEALRLQTTDKPFIQAMQSYQEFLKPTLEPLVYAFHRRPLEADGDVGPATNVLRQMPRCNHPDFEIREADDPEVGRLWAREEANWPPTCRREIVTGRDFAALPGLSEAETDGIWWASCHNWTESFSDIHMTPGKTGNKSGARFYARKEQMGGNILAYSWLAQNRCDIQLDQAYNSGVRWNMALAATTKTHEDGHALGCNHQNDGQATMYPGITSYSMARYGYPNATDIAAVRNLGYSPHADWQARRPSLDRLFKPRESDPPDTPTGKVSFLGVVKVLVDGQEVGEMLAIPNPYGDM